MAATSSTHSQAEQSGAEQIAVLMDQMRSKDALVLQLTERLEQAAEQLDRIQRTGSDRRVAGGGGGSRELVEQTGQLTTRVEEALESWGQTSTHYEVILERLNEIADRLGSSSVVVDAKPAPRTGSSSTPAASAPASANGNAGPGQGSFWEKMKASMADGSPAPAPPSSSAASAAASAAGGASSGSPETSTPTEEEVMAKLAPPPVVIAIDTATIEELREAVTTRDAYISSLISELRMAHPLPALPQDLMNSGLVPEELLASLVELETRLKTGVQRENLELALEKARMGRERARLDQVKTQLEEQIKRMTTPLVEKPVEEPLEIGGKNMSWLKRVTGNKK